MKQLFIYPLAVVIAAQLFSCSAFEKAGKSLGTGLDTKTKSIGSNVVSGAQTQLTDSTFRENLKHFLDSVITAFGAKTTTTLGALRDSLLNDKWHSFAQLLIEDITGSKTKTNLSALVETAAGDATKKRLQALIDNALKTLFSENTHAQIEKLREELIGARTKENIGYLRNELLNETTKAALAGIVDSAMLRIAYRMKHDVGDAVNTNASFIQKYASRILMIAGGVAALIIWLVWRNRQKYLKLVTVLTSQINSVKDKDKNVYEDLTSNIKDRAVQAGVEPALRKILAENNLLKEAVAK